MTKENARKIAEIMVTLYDEHNTTWVPLGEVISEIHGIEDDLLWGDTEEYINWLKMEIEEFKGNEEEEDYLDLCNHVLKLIENGE